MVTLSEIMNLFQSSFRRVCFELCWAKCKEWRAEIDFWPLWDCILLCLFKTPCRNPFYVWKTFANFELLSNSTEVFDLSYKNQNSRKANESCWKHTMTLCCFGMKQVRSSLLLYQALDSARTPYLIFSFH